MMKVSLFWGKPEPLLNLAQCQYVTSVSQKNRAATINMA